MTNDEIAKRSNLLKFEAQMLFTQVKAQFSTDRWVFFAEARRQAFPCRVEQSISPYRATLHFSYVFQDIPFDAYLEREALVGRMGEHQWTLSFPGIEGKTHAQLLRDSLSPLRSQGFDIPNGEEYLDRQMNFSLGLYGDCLMRVDVKFPTGRPAFASFCAMMDQIEALNTRHPLHLAEVSQLLARRQAELAAMEDDDTLIMGDWQTWK